MPTQHRTDYGEVMDRMTDTEWYAEQRRQMGFAFGDVDPALVTMHWWNLEIKRRLCTHLWQTSEDGQTCVRCDETRDPATGHLGSCCGCHECGYPPDAQISDEEWGEPRR